MPKAEEWARWLRTNLPAYIGDISIEAAWKTGSALVFFVLPIEVWLSLPERDAYSFVDYHRSWDAAAARQRQLNLLAPPQQQQQQLPHRPGWLQLQEQVHPGTGMSPQQQPSDDESK